MSVIPQRYALPPEIDRFVDQDFLEVLAERPDEMTVEFHIPAKLSIDRRRRITAYSVVWIHPDHNADFCHFYQETPGDLPNFFVEVKTSDGPPEMIDDLETVDDLEAWLEDLQSISVYP
jgi:hypothetical protein